MIGGNMRTLTLKVASGLLYLGGGIRLPSERRKDSPLVGGHPNTCTVAPVRQALLMLKARFPFSMGNLGDILISEHLHADGRYLNIRKFWALYILYLSFFAPARGRVFRECSPGTSGTAENVPQRAQRAKMCKYAATVWNSIYLISDIGIPS